MKYIIVLFWCIAILDLIIIKNIPIMKSRRNFRHEYYTVSVITFELFMVFDKIIILFIVSGMDKYDIIYFLSVCILICIICEFPLVTYIKITKSKLCFCSLRHGYRKIPLDKVQKCAKVIKPFYIWGDILYIYLGDRHILLHTGFSLGGSDFANHLLETIGVEADPKIDGLKIRKLMLKLEKEDRKKRY